MRRYTSLLPPLVWLHFTVSNWLFSCLISVNTLWTIIKIQWLLISIQKSIMSESENSFLRNSHAKRPNTTIRTSLLDFVRRRPFYCTFCILYWITLTRNLGKNMHNSHINRTPPWQRNQTASLRLSAGTKQTAEENQNSPNGHLQKEKSLGKINYSSRGSHQEKVHLQCPTKHSGLNFCLYEAIFGG